MKLSHIAALAIGILIGVGGTLALHINRPGPDAGDWLAFVGALVGVSITIIGTLWLEDYRASRQEREGLEIYKTALTEIKTKLEAAARERGTEEIPAFRRDQIAKEQQLARAFQKFVYARHYVPKTNIAAWQSAEELWSQIADEKPILENETRLITDAGENENVLSVNLSKMDQIRDRLVPFIESASKTLD